MYLDKNNFIQPNWYLRGEDRLRRTAWLPSVQKFPVSLFPMVTTMEHVKISVGTLFQLFLSKQSKSLMEKIYFLSPCQALCKIHKLKSQANSILYAPKLSDRLLQNPQIQACDLTNIYCGMSQGKWNYYWTVKLFPSVHLKTCYFKRHVRCFYQKGSNI